MGERAIGDAHRRLGITASIVVPGQVSLDQWLAAKDRPNAWGVKSGGEHHCGRSNTDLGRSRFNARISFIYTNWSNLMFDVTGKATRRHTSCRSASYNSIACSAPKRIYATASTSGSRGQVSNSATGSIVISTLLLCLAYVDQQVGTNSQESLDCRHKDKQAEFLIGTKCVLVIASALHSVQTSLLR